ncbi:hypothetical protein CL619_03920 [archaeon]|nr:hypothetical protein [archaeon]|tara:strand:+ start:5371 stop:6153 length:783 start_codon:yes stop_codon:yes gene_type:complete
MFSKSVKTVREADTIKTGLVFRVLEKDSPNFGGIFFVASYEAPYFKLTELGDGEMDPGHRLPVTSVPPARLRDDYFQIKTYDLTRTRLEKVLVAIHQAAPYFVEARKLELRFNLDERLARVGFFESLDDSIFGEINYRVTRRRVVAKAKQIDVKRLGITSRGNCASPSCRSCAQIVDPKSLTEVIDFFLRKGLGSNLDENQLHSFGRPGNWNSDTYIGKAEAFVAGPRGNKKGYESLRSARDELIAPIGELSRVTFPARK